MSHFLICFVGVLLATNLSAATNSAIKPRAVAVKIAGTNNSVDRELQKLMEQDDEAQIEVDKWIRDNEEFAANGAGTPPAKLNERILKRFETVRQGYEDFIHQHTNHVRARIAYASFLRDIRDEAGQRDQLEKARELDPTDPALWNNLANYYGRNGPVTNAFDYYAKAMELNPAEPLYPHNLGKVVYLFHKDAMEHYGINAQQVFDKALDLFRRALKLDPENFLLATDLAQTYYGFRPIRTDDGLNAWTNALRLAPAEIDRERVAVHLARLKIQAGRFAEARAHLNTVTNEEFADLKRDFLRDLLVREAVPTGTNAPPARAD